MKTMVVPGVTVGDWGRLRVPLVGDEFRMQLPLSKKCRSRDNMTGGLDVVSVEPR